MSLQTNPLPENRDNIESKNISPEIQLSELERNFIDNYKLSLHTFNELKEFVTKKDSQDNLINLKDFIQVSEISESEKKSLNNITDKSFQKFTNEVFTQLESSKQQLFQLDTYIHGEYNESITSSQKSNYISNARYSRASNPTKPHHHLDGCLVGITHSVVSLGQGTINLIGDTIKTPYDTYLLVTNQATTNDFKNI